MNSVVCRLRIELNTLRFNRLSYLRSMYDLILELTNNRGSPNGKLVMESHRCLLESDRTPYRKMEPSQTKDRMLGKSIMIITWRVNRYLFIL